MINTWRKELQASDVGKKKMHDKYLNIPKEIVRKSGEGITPFTGKVTVSPLSIELSKTVPSTNEP